MCLCVYVFMLWLRIHFYPNPYIHLYLIPIHLYTHTPIHLYTYTPLNLYTFIPLYLYTSIPLYLYTFIPLYLYTFIPLYLYTFIPLSLYTYTSHPILTLHFANCLLPASYWQFPAVSRVQLSGDHIHTAHCQYSIRNITAPDHLGIGLIVDETRPSQVKTEGCSSPVTDKVESQFAITAFHTVIYFSFRHISFSHYDLEMVDERLHIIIDLF